MVLPSSFFAVTCSGIGMPAIAAASMLTASRAGPTLTATLPVMAPAGWVAVALSV